MKKYSFELPDYSLLPDIQLMEEATYIGEKLIYALNFEGRGTFFDKHKRLMAIMIRFHFVYREIKSRYPELSQRVEESIELESFLNKLKISMNEEE